MKRSILCVLLLLSSVSAFAGQPGALNVLIFGKIEAPDPVDYAAVRKVLGRMVADLSISKYSVLEWGVEGGFKACIQPRQNTANVLQRLQAIEINADQTLYSVTAADGCN